MTDNATRVRITVSYDGTAYAGWQRQQNAPSIQQTLEAALLRLTGEEIAVTGASRTDAGVHALGQVAHFDTFSRIPPERFALALNTHLPPDIRLVGSAACTTAFHARYAARGKTYRYQIHNSAYPSALYRNQRAHVIPPLDVQAMRDAARLVIGEHDFRAFAASGGEAKKTIRDIREVCLDRSGDLIEITVTGRSFLYNMVRILAGTLISIGVKKIPADAFLTAFRTGSRLDLGVTAPAHGLTLMAVYYDGDSL